MNHMMPTMLWFFAIWLLLLSCEAQDMETPKRKHCLLVIRDDGKHGICNGTGLEAVKDLPSDIVQLQLFHSNLTVIQGSPFVHLQELRILHLQSNRIRDLLGTTLVGLNKLEVLDLKHNSIRVLHPNVFAPCEHLREVDLTDNSVLQMQSVAKALASLQKLQVLSLKENRLQTLDANELRPLANTSLQQLDLSSCALTQIHENAFAPLQSLSHLSLAFNPLTNDKLSDSLSSLYRTSLSYLNLQGLTPPLQNVPTNALIHLNSTNIQTLVLSENSFSKISVGDFPHLPSLRRLELDNCEIQYIDDEAFANLTSLDELYMRSNHLSQLPDGITRVLTLRILDLSNNHAVQTIGDDSPFTIKDFAFQNQTSLQELYLRNLHLFQIQRNTFHGLSNLKRLILEHCFLRLIDDYSFESLHSLLHLDLSGNTLGSLSDDTFVGLKSLILLLLRASQLELESESSPFQHLSSLRELNLNSNKLMNLPIRDLAALLQLQVLRADGNAIAPWQQQTLPTNSSLQMMSLRQNNINFVTPAMLKDFDVLTEVDISENPFNCSTCELQEFRQWANATHVKILNTQSTICIGPEEVSSQPVLEAALKFDHCRLNRMKMTIVLAASLSAIVLFIAMMAAFCYYFRWYIRYWWFLSRSKIKRHKDIVKSDSYKYDAFVSYNEKDRSWVIQQLLPTLETSSVPRLKLCLHERDFEVGREVMDNIVESIDTSRKIVLLISNNFLASQWCLWEMHIAQFRLFEESRDALVLVLLENINKSKMTSTLRYLLRTRTYLEWTDNPQGQKLFWERLKQALERPTGKLELRPLV